MLDISAALGSAKAIYDLLKGANDTQLAMKISGEVAGIQGRLIDLQQQTLQLQQENQDLRDQIRERDEDAEEEKGLSLFTASTGEPVE